jgi:hypothetical protein
MVSKSKKKKNMDFQMYCNNTLKNPFFWLFIPALMFAIVFGLGYSYAPQLSKIHIASGAELELARTQISEQYLEASSTKCTNPSDPIKPFDRIAVFYKYLRVNRYANRAVIRGCNNSDTLLAKVQSGRWEPTFINVSLDLRANPAWQKACLIDDITVADNAVRPENNSIDLFNLEACNYLKVHNQIKNFD